MAFLSLLGAVAIPAWQQRISTQRLTQLTENLVQDLRSARHLSLLHNTAYYIHFDTTMGTSVGTSLGTTVGATTTGDN